MHPHARPFGLPQSIPGQEDVCEWFESRMSRPEKLHRDSSGEALPFRNKFRSVIHGDLWHNNLYFLKEGVGTSSGGDDERPTFLMADWQMCHVGSATNDLCFLLFSSTTPAFRREHWDATLALYYDGFVSPLRRLGVSERELTVSYEELQMAVKASVPLALFFCGNVQVGGWGECKQYERTGSHVCTSFLTGL